MHHEHQPGCGHIPEPDQPMHEEHHHEHHEACGHMLGRLGCGAACQHPEHQHMQQLFAEQQASLEDDDDGEYDEFGAKRNKKNKQQRTIRALHNRLPLIA